MHFEQALSCCTKCNSNFILLETGIIADRDIIITAVTQHWINGITYASHNAIGELGTRGGDLILFIFDDGGYLLAYSWEIYSPLGYVTVDQTLVLFAVKSEAYHGFTVVSVELIYLDVSLSIALMIILVLLSDLLNLNNYAYPLFFLLLINF